MGTVALREGKRADRVGGFVCDGAYIHPSDGSRISGGYHPGRHTAILQEDQTETGLEECLAGRAGTGQGEGCLNQ